MASTPQFKLSRLQTLQAAAKGKRENRLASFRAYPRQRDFLDLGAKITHRLLMAANQIGKSTVGAYEVALHATGAYPPDWAGKRFDRPIKIICGGISGEVLRNVTQEKLFGGPIDSEQFGQGMLPKASIINVTRAHGISGLVDMAEIRHASGGVSEIYLKSYEQGAQKWMGIAGVGVIWYDEEPPPDIHSEGNTRLAGDGITFCTFTPMGGWTQVVSKFLREYSPDRAVVRAGLSTAEHFSPEEKERRFREYPEHERAARAEGEPLLGSGAVWEDFDINTLATPIRLQDVPRHHRLLWGIDFGIGHPFAAVLVSHDGDSDTITVLDCFKVSGASTPDHCSRMKSIAPSVPVAWPHDGAQREKSSGDALILAYKAQGLRTLSDHAQFEDRRGNSTEAGITDMLDRMRSGRFRVASHLTEWFEEARMYHRKDGLIVKLFDDIMSASRMAVMSIRYARARDDNERWGSKRLDWGARPRHRDYSIPPW